MKSRVFDEYPVKPGESGFFQLDVTSNLYGQTIFVPLHVVRGAKQGPTLLLMATVHGNEHPPIRTMYELLRSLRPEDLSGSIMMVPVANPAAFARDKRRTPEIDIDFTNMNRVFPGRRSTPAFGEGQSQPSDVTLTELITQVIADRVIPYCDFMMDFHCHAEGCCLSESICPPPEEDVNGMGKSMAVAFGWGIIHEDSSSCGTASGFARSLGIPSFSPEIGGSEMGSRLESVFIDIQVQGTLNVMRRLGMYPGEIRPFVTDRFVYRQCPKVRPTVSGYLVSRITPEMLYSDDILSGKRLGVRVSPGVLLGEVFDPYSLKMVEELTCPVGGLLYMSRRDGPVLAGSLVYGIAADQGGRIEK